MMPAFASTMPLGVATTFAVSAGFSSLYTLAAIYAFSWFGVSVERFLHPRNMIAGMVE
jgi:hypothetical protein